MAEPECGSDGKKIAIAALNTIAAISLTLTALWAVGLTIGDAVFGYLPIDASFLCGLVAATITGLGSIFLYRHLYKRFGSLAAISGLFAIPFYYLPEWTLPVIGAAVGCIAIWLSIQWINRRDFPRFKPPASNSGASQERS